MRKVSHADPLAPWTARTNSLSLIWRTRFTAAMGKIDEMRRQREQQMADAEARHAPPKRDVAAALTVAQAALAPKPSSADDEKGTCSVCGKTKALANGLLVQHQKGLGKPCAGSRKPPSTHG